MCGQSDSIFWILVSQSELTINCSMMMSHVIVEMGHIFSAIPFSGRDCAVLNIVLGLDLQILYLGWTYKFQEYNLEKA